MRIVQDRSDQPLIEKCRQGQLFSRYERLVFSIAPNYGLTRDDVVDIAQLTFPSLVQHLDRLPLDSNLDGWLATIARRHAFHHLRKYKQEFPGKKVDITESHFLLNTPGSDATTYWERVDWLNQGLNSSDERCQIGEGV